MKTLNAVLVLFSVYHAVQSANILFVATEPSAYYQILNQNIYQTLRKKGHNITVISTEPFRDYHFYFNIEEPEEYGLLDSIDVGSLQVKYAKKLKPTPRLNLTALTFTEAMKRHTLVTDVYSELAERILSHGNVRNLLKEDREFDVCVIELFFPAMTAFAHKFKCPFIALSLAGTKTPFYTHSLPVPREPTFWNRMTSLLLKAYAAIYYHAVVLPREDNITRTYIGTDLPYLGDIASNYSLMLENTDKINGAYEVAPNTVDISGAFKGDESLLMIKSMSVALNFSTEGIIYVNFGPYIETRRFTKAKLDLLLNTFEKLPYYVMIKWEEHQIHNHPINVYTARENPQNQILEHENVKLFITGGDRQSVEESIKHHVPIIGIPFFADDAETIRKCVELGIGKSLNFLTLTQEALNETIHEVISNSVYTENVIKLEELLYDQPVRGLDSAVWWIEYIIKHKGNPRLRDSRSEIPFYQYYSLDVIGVLLLSVLLPNYLLYKVMRFLKNNLGMKAKKVSTIKDKKVE